MLSEADWAILEKYRLHRFQAEFFHYPAIFHVTLDNQLQIHCGARAEANEIIANGDALIHFAYLILGVDSIKIYFAGRLDWAAGVSLSHEPQPKKSMRTTLERPTTNTPSSTLKKPPAVAQAEEVPLEALAEKIATLTGETVEFAMNKILEAAPVLRFTGGAFYAPASAGDVAIDEWAASLKAQLRSGTASPAATSKPKALKKTIKKASTEK